MDIDGVYKLATDSKEYKNYMDDIRSLGSEVMKLLGENKDLFAKYEKSMWMAEEICIKLALDKGNIQK